MSNAIREQAALDLGSLQEAIKEEYAENRESERNGPKSP